MLIKNTQNNKIQKWIKEGRGQGFGNNYKPWLTVRDVVQKVALIEFMVIKPKNIISCLI
jgi:hypothetical protein